MDEMKIKSYFQQAHWELKGYLDLGLVDVEKRMNWPFYAFVFYPRGIISDLKYGLFPIGLNKINPFGLSVLE